MNRIGCYTARIGSNRAIGSSLVTLQHLWVKLRLRCAPEMQDAIQEDDAMGPAVTDPNTDMCMTVTDSNADMCMNGSYQHVLNDMTFSTC
jgi:hypothetical protein